MLLQKLWDINVLPKEIFGIVIQYSCFSFPDKIILLLFQNKLSFTYGDFIIMVSACEGVDVQDFTKCHVSLTLMRLRDYDYTTNTSLYQFILSLQNNTLHLLIPFLIWDMGSQICLKIRQTKLC